MEGTRGLGRGCGARPRVRQPLQRAVQEEGRRCNGWEDCEVISVSTMKNIMWGTDAESNSNISMYISVSVCINSHIGYVGERDRSCFWVAK